jgi:hypothetical protein
MYFDGAPLAHVVLYYDRLRRERLDRSLARMSGRRRGKTTGLGSVLGALRFLQTSL